MAMVTYTNPSFGFGVTYDDELITQTDDRTDLRLRAAWSARIPTGSPPPSCSRPATRAPRASPAASPPASC